MPTRPSAYDRRPACAETTPVNHVERSVVAGQRCVIRLRGIARAAHASHSVVCATTPNGARRHDVSVSINTVRTVMRHLYGYASVGLGLLFCHVCYADSGTDPLAATVKPQVAALFGSGSTIAYCIYIAEIVLGSVAYIKTKNILLLLGVPILMLFTHTMFTYIGG